MFVATHLVLFSVVVFSFTVNVRQAYMGLLTLNWNFPFKREDNEI